MLNPRGQSVLRAKIFGLGLGLSLVASSTLLQIFHKIHRWKKFENQSIFGEDNGTTKVSGLLFGGHPVLYCIVTDHRRRRGRSSRLDSDIGPMNRQRSCLDSDQWRYKPPVTPAHALDTHRQTKPNEFSMGRHGLATVPSWHGTGAPFEK